MSAEKPVIQNLKGHLLLADPGLREPTFFQSVLLLTEHSRKEGAHGYILNRPLGKTVGELLTDEAFQSGQFQALSETPVFMGGPVSPEHLTFASMGWSPNDNKLQFSTHLSAGEAVMHEMEGYQVRAFVGYSGWEGGQLEEELTNHSWIAGTPDSRVMKVQGIEKLWKDIVRGLSPWHKMIADEPDNLGLN